MSESKDTKDTKEQKKEHKETKQPEPIILSPLSPLPLETTHHSTPQQIAARRNANMEDLSGLTAPPLERQSGQKDSLVRGLGATIRQKNPNLKKEEFIDKLTAEVDTLLKKEAGTGQDMENKEYQSVIERVANDFYPKSRPSM